MNAVEHINGLLAEFGGPAGLDLGLEDGFCGLELEGGRRVVVAVPEAADAVWAYTVLMETDAADRAGAAERALRLNFFEEDLGGTWLAMDRDGAVLLCAVREAGRLDAGRFENLILGMAELADTLARRLADPDAPPPPEDPDADPEAAGNPELRYGRRV